MTVRKGTALESRPVAAMRQPSFRASRPAVVGAAFELFGGAEGQPFSTSFDAAVRVTRQVQDTFEAVVIVQHPFVLLVDLGQHMGGRVNLLADTGARIRGSTALHSDVRVRIGLRVSRQADLSQRIGVGAQLSADVALKVYRVVLHKDHLILI